MIRVAALLFLLASGAQAQGLAEGALDQLAKAEAQLRNAGSADDRLIALTAAVQAYDESLAMLREAARDVAESEAVQSEVLLAQQARVARLLGVLSAVDRSPQVIRHAHPDGPAATLQP